MNFLAHLYLSGDNPEIIVGNFMGDFIKGRVDDSFPPGIRSGIILHRKIDVYVQQHPIFKTSRHRISGEYGLFRGIIIDLFYDHFLAAGWNLYCTEPLDVYLERVRAMVGDAREWLPERLVHLWPGILNELIPSYSDVEGIGSALARMAGRLRRQNPLAGAETQLVAHYDELFTDFRTIFPQVMQFSQREASGLRKYAGCDVDTSGDGC